MVEGEIKIDQTIYSEEEDINIAIDFALHLKNPCSEPGNPKNNLGSDWLEHAENKLKELKSVKGFKNMVAISILENAIVEYKQKNSI